MADSAKERYTQLAVLRQPYLDRAREASALTIPSLIPPDGHNPASKLPEPNQGFGARLVVHLASYFTSALLPPGRQFFRLGVTPEALLQSGQKAAPADLEANLSLIERIPHNEVARRNWRSPTGVSLQHLLVGGNAMEVMQADNTIVVHPLSRFVVVRSPAGALIEFIIEEPLDPAALPDELKQLAPAEGSVPGGQRLCLYTWGRFENGEWNVTQQFEDQPVGTPGKYAPNTLPFFALRWQAVAGEDYGRGKVEEHIADLRTFDGLSKSIRDGSAMASRNITMIRPNAAAGVNLRRKLASANNGEFVVGNPEDVAMLQFTNVTGLQVVQAELATLRQELGAAFMLSSGVIRDAERVTQEEIRRVTQELDSVQGGAYSMLSQEMLRPRVDRLLYQMRQAKQLPQWDDALIDPTILTGLEAMGRELELSNVAQARGLLEGLPPDVHEDYIKWSELLKKGMTALQLADCVNTEEEANARRQQRMQMQATMDAAVAAAGPVAQATAQAATQQ